MLLSKIVHKMLRFTTKRSNWTSLHQFNDVLILKLLAEWEIDPINLNEGGYKESRTTIFKHDRHCNILW